MSTDAELGVTFESSIAPFTELPVDCDAPTEETPYCLAVSVTRNVNISAFVFVHQAAVFCKVASVQDLDNLAPTTPASGQTQYRLTTADLCFATLEELEEAKATMQFLLDALVKDVTCQNDNFIASEVVNFPLV